MIGRQLVQPHTQNFLRGVFDLLTIRDLMALRTTSTAHRGIDLEAQFNAYVPRVYPTDADVMCECIMSFRRHSPTQVELTRHNRLCRCRKCGAPAAPGVPGHMCRTCAHAVTFRCADCAAHLPLHAVEISYPPGDVYVDNNTHHMAAGSIYSADRPIVRCAGPCQNDSCQWCHHAWSKCTCISVVTFTDEITAHNVDDMRDERAKFMRFAGHSEYDQDDEYSLVPRRMTL